MVAAVVARRLSVPVLVLFLGLGMLLGSDGQGGIYFDDARLARELGVVGLVAILFEGGLTARWQDLRRVAVPAVLLSTVGVAVTTAVVAVAAHTLLDLAWAASFLLGAVVGSTDAAAWPDCSAPSRGSTTRRLSLSRSASLPGSPSRPTVSVTWPCSWCASLASDS